MRPCLSKFKFKFNDVDLRARVMTCLSVYINKSSAVAEMGDRLTTIDMDRKWGAAVPLSLGEL